MICYKVPYLKIPKHITLGNKEFVLEICKWLYSGITKQLVNNLQVSPCPSLKNTIGRWGLEVLIPARPLFCDSWQDATSSDGQWVHVQTGSQWCKNTVGVVDLHRVLDLVLLYAVLPVKHPFDASTWSMFSWSVKQRRRFFDKYDILINKMHVYLKYLYFVQFQQWSVKVLIHPGLLEGRTSSIRATGLVFLYHRRSIFSTELNFFSSVQLVKHLQDHKNGSGQLAVPSYQQFNLQECLFF